MVTLFPMRSTYSKTEFPLALNVHNFNPLKKIKARLPLYSNNVSASVYFPEEEQTDGSPLITADGSKINAKSIRQHRWVAVSRNLLKRWGGKLHYGDSLQVSGISEELDGTYIIRDTMNKRLRNTIDILVGKNDRIMGHWKNVKITKFETVVVSN
jgi:3D (Asp-Asp-Asp) domain-containing protein